MTFQTTYRSQSEMVDYTPLPINAASLWLSARDYPRASATMVNWACGASSWFSPEIHPLEGYGYKIRRIHAFFDTSSIGTDNRIVAARLLIALSGVGGIALADWLGWNWGDPVVVAPAGLVAQGARYYSSWPHNPIDITDYGAFRYDAGGLLGSGAISGSSATVELTPSGIEEIDVAGTTRFTLRTIEDYASTPPTDDPVNEHVINATVIDTVTLEIDVAAVSEKRLFVRPDGCEAGDLFVHDGTKLARLPRGANGQVLKIAGGTPTWSTP